MKSKAEILKDVMYVTDTPPSSINPELMSRAQKIYYVYIMSSQLHVLYIGITSNIVHRVFQHKTRALGGFTARYNVTSLVHFDRFHSVSNAIAREKELKGWRREKKIALIESKNPKWRDLSYEWFRRHQWQPDGKLS